MASENAEDREERLQRWKENKQEFGARTFEISVQYAEMYLKHCFILNGGSILAFPTIAQISGIDAQNHLVGFVISIGSFAFGLFASLISVIASSAWFDKKTRIAGIEAQLIQMMIDNKDKNDDADWILARGNLGRAASWSQRYMKATIVSGSISALLFIVGIIVAGLVVSELDQLIF